jgi:hypothetical protein
MAGGKQGAHEPAAWRARASRAARAGTSGGWNSSSAKETLVEPIEILFSVLFLVFSASSVAIAYATYRHQFLVRSPPQRQEGTNDTDRPEGRPETRRPGSRSRPWQRELIDVGIAAAATVGVGLLIRATPWGDCGTCDDVMEFGRYPLADIVVVLIGIVVVRAILRFSATRERAFLGVGAVLALLSAYGLMWLATVVWGGTLDARTVQSDPGKAKFAVYVGGYSDFDPTLRTVVMASVIVALSNLSAWISARPSVD